MSLPPGKATKIKVKAPYSKSPEPQPDIDKPISSEHEAFFNLKVADDNGAPLPGAIAVLEPATGPALAKRANQNGQVSFIAVPEGMCGVLINPPGTLLIEGLRKDGMGFKHMGGIRIQAGWTCIEPFALDEHLYLFAYKSDTGDVAISRMATDLQDVEVVWSDKWPPGWTSIRVLPSDGQVYLIESNPASGAFAIDHILPQGTGVERVWSATWTTGWEIILPVKLSGAWYLFEYKPSAGTVVIDALRNNFHGVDEKWRSTWTKNWAIDVFYKNGWPHLLEHKITDNTLVIDKIRSQGAGVDELWRGTVLAGNVLVVYSGSSPYLLRRTEAGGLSVSKIPGNTDPVESIWDADSPSAISIWAGFGSLFLDYYP